MYRNMKQFIVCRVHILCNVLQLIKHEEIYRYLTQGRPSRHIAMPSLRYWICADTSIKSGWVKRLLWATISTLSEMIFSLKIRSALIVHCIYYTIQLSDINLYRFFSFVLVFWFCFLVCFVCFFLLLFFCFFVFGFIFGINNDKL